MTTVTLDPTTRLEGHLKVQVQSDAGRVTLAQSSGMMYRGFENLLVGKDPRDAIHITQRICGVCPVCHAMASSLALEAAANVQAVDNGRIVRNLILGADFLHSHILHFYHLSLPDYVSGPAMPPWTPNYAVDLRMDAATNQRLVEHYIAALTARRQAHECGAILGGKLPHAVAYEFGGVTTTPHADEITRFRALLQSVTTFIDSVYLPDVELLATHYSDYYQIGRGYGNLMAYGVFDLNGVGSSKLLGRGRIIDGSTNVQGIDLSAITEQVQHSWYDDIASGHNPAQGITLPNPDKASGYSWLKAPRYAHTPYETGALARMWVNGDYRRGISVMDRHQARAREASKIAHAMSAWVDQLNLTAPFMSQLTLPSSGSGIGLTEAPRGALGHWLQVSASAISRYQILTPTCWNCSPRDGNDMPGPLEKALEGTPLVDAAQPVEVLRVVHSFDPCLSCAVH